MNIKYPAARHVDEYRPILVTMIFLCFFAPAWCALDKNDKKSETEVFALRQLLDQTRDSLQNDMAARWKAKQGFVEQRENDKEELLRLKEIQEKAYSELERAKEECFSGEKMTGDAVAANATKVEEWNMTLTALDEVLTKEAEAVSGVFPLDLETRRNDIENLRRQFRKKHDAASTLNGFAGYTKKYLEQGGALSLVKQTILPDDGKPQLLTIARFGNVFGYGMNENGGLYLISQVGRIGDNRYCIDKMAAAPLQSVLLGLFPKWMEANKISGKVPTDVMQNDQTKMLVAGKKVSGYHKLYESLKAGGAVMIPLLLLPLWAVFIVVFKLFQFGFKRSIYARQYKKVSVFFDNNNIVQALAYIKTEKGVLARMIEFCLKNKDRGRGIAEKNMREMFIEEIPEMNRYLNTLAVIAGAAPLLGLLGTISGMINLFGAVTHYGAGDPKFLAGGISEALITAKTGLAIAIPALFIHDYLRNKKDRLQADIEKYALRILNRLYPDS